MKTIYLIHASSGEYDDHTSWVVTGFFSEIRANLKMEELQLRNEAELIHLEVSRRFQYEWIAKNPAPQLDVRKMGYRDFPKIKKPMSTKDPRYKELERERQEIQEHNRKISQEMQNLHIEWQTKLKDARTLYLREAGVPEWYIEKIAGDVYASTSEITYSVEPLEIEDDPC